MYVHTSLYVHIHVYTCIYIYIYIYTYCEKVQHHGVAKVMGADLATMEFLCRKAARAAGAVSIDRYLGRKIGT